MLWFKSAPSLKASGMFEGFTDWHSHILPGVDDGIKTLYDSLEVLKLYEALGFKKVWLTPHVMEEYQNTPEKLRGVFNELKSAWQGSVELGLASENMLDTVFEERLESNLFLPIGEQGNHLLVETSYFTPPYNMQDMIERAMAKGYFVVLAHPERYRYMEKTDYKKWKDMGVKFQANFTSLVGGYGETAQQKSQWLLENDMLDFLGSDVHRLNSIAALIEKKTKNKKYLESLKKLAANPEAI